MLNRIGQDWQHFRRDEDGSVAVLVGVSLGLLISFASVAVDVGYAMATKAGLQTVAKAAALAGARELGVLYEGRTYSQQTSYVLSTSDRAAVTAAVREIAQKNPVLGQAIEIPDSDIQVGKWDFVDRTFTVTTAQPNAVKITTRRDGGANGPITMFMSKIMGVSVMNLSVYDIAAMGPIGMVPPGELDLPIAISKAWFASHTCGNTIKFYPTGDISGCAGWHTFEDHPASASQLTTILNGLKNGTYQSPETTFGVTKYEFMGGVAASKFSDIQALYDAKKDANGEWKTFITVYDSNNCDNPSGSLTIVGFTTAVVTQVTTSPSKSMTATLECNVVETGRPGGPDYGTNSSVPTVVQES
jgi:Flp pilus assembly protein TadG